MAKRSCSDSLSPRKKSRLEHPLSIGNVASPEAAAAVDADPPLKKLLRSLENVTTAPPNSGDAVVYWMRMEDMRIYDNRALAQASVQALKDHVPLLVFFVLSPQDYAAHDRSPRRVDFTLRNLCVLKGSLAKLDIPLHVTTHASRRTLPSYVVSFLQSVNATRLFANIEYEVDELRRDITVCNLANEAGILPTLVHDKLIVEPGLLSTKQGKPYSVFSPFQRQWLAAINKNPNQYLAEAVSPSANPPTVRDHPILGKMFSSEVPSRVEGFQCLDKHQMAVIWPAGMDAAREMLRRFLRTKSRHTQSGLADPLGEGAETSEKKSRAMAYKDDRDRADRDSTSRLSPYLAAGVISSRECIRAALELVGATKVHTNRDTGIGMWIQEIAWRDFYTHVLAAFPRVSMGRPFQEKYADVQWETNPEHFEAWRTGRTGVPIVDAAIRQANTMGWMHNRARMVAAMYLTKDLMIDWRLGERVSLHAAIIDGDLASNNGGWQWSASTGTDPQPYFRIFNPYSQSEKADPNGDYIRTFVPELGTVFGPEIHNPPAKLADKLGYPRPLVDHKEARDRALRRYKNPGSK
ncbi:DNA photolyase, FAD-binding/Cryptochrome [Lactarius akahatsu]|uniref:DNA photolyase, FAD-binding/Cryptochrome n=1 Tax=Lactarius akahatsu TaxID=416441 RepID=A0AAD4QBZ9_9AGAM|nr:DNA photolyase, FAD-binding/Cryptochrome [Lactarius akahatsu]